MVDFVSNYYYNIGDKYSDEDKSRAKQKAVGTVLPLIMENELTKKQSGMSEIQVYKRQNPKGDSKSDETVTAHCITPHKCRKGDFEQ